MLWQIWQQHVKRNYLLDVKSSSNYIHYNLNWHFFEYMHITQENVLSLATNTCRTKRTHVHTNVSTTASVSKNERCSTVGIFWTNLAWSNSLSDSRTISTSWTPTLLHIYHSEDIQRKWSAEFSMTTHIFSTDIWEFTFFFSSQLELRIFLSSKLYLFLSWSTNA